MGKYYSLFLFDLYGILFFFFGCVIFFLCSNFFVYFIGINFFVNFFKILRIYCNNYNIFFFKYKIGYYDVYYNK